jgi:dolichyl-phosphate beta-glucosyltransferase
MASELPRLTIIIPAFNEAPRMADCAGHLKDALTSGILCPHTTELILVDDGSTDGTGELTQELLTPMFRRLRIIRLDHNAGKGAAVRAGITAAAAPVVIFMDADMSVTPDDIPAFLHAVGSADVAIGSRSVPESVVESYDVPRRVMGRTFNRLVRSLTGLPFWDTQCGIKAFRTPAARLLFHLTKAQRFAFDVEALYLASLLGMEITEVGVNWHERPGSSIRLLADPLTMVYDVMSLRWLRERPPVPALAITRHSGTGVASQGSWSQVSRALGTRHPLLVMPDDLLMVLLPLCDAVMVRRTAHQLRRLSADFNVDERSISFAQLRSFAPLDRLMQGEAGMVVASHEDVVEFDGSSLARLNAGHPNGNVHVARAHPD